MQNVLLINSRDHFGCANGGFVQEFAQRLAQGGAAVTLFLVQNGVLHARRGIASDGLARLHAAGVTILADDFSLRERGIATEVLVPGVRASPLDVVVDRLIAGWRVIFH